MGKSKKTPFPFIRSTVNHQKFKCSFSIGLICEISTVKPELKNWHYQNFGFLASWIKLKSPENVQNHSYNVQAAMSQRFFWLKTRNDTAIKKKKQCKDAKNLKQWFTTMWSWCKFYQKRSVNHGQLKIQIMTMVPIFSCSEINMNQFERLKQSAERQCIS